MNKFCLVQSQVVVPTKNVDVFLEVGPGGGSYQFDGFELFNVNSTCPLCKNKWWYIIPTKKRKALAEQHWY